MLRWTCLRLECHRGRIDCPLVWDLTHNVTFAAWKEKTYEEKLPCVLRGHRYYHCGRQSSLVASCKLQPNIVTYYMWNMAVRGVSLCECVNYLTLLAVVFFYFVCRVNFEHFHCHWHKDWFLATSSYGDKVFQRRSLQLVTWRHVEILIMVNMWRCPPLVIWVREEGDWSAGNR